MRMISYRNWLREIVLSSNAKLWDLLILLAKHFSSILKHLKVSYEGLVDLRTLT